MNDTTNQSIGKYEILEELGRGGFGTVFRVRNLDLGREEALKILDAHRRRDPTFVRRFQREARAAARLRHPNIVTIYEVGEIEGTHYLAMEYLPGQTLERLMRGGETMPGGEALPLERVDGIIMQVAEALDYAHAQGLVHRDIKPSNIMVGQATRGDGDHITLMDFGLVRAADNSEMTQALFSTAGGMTSVAMTMGTPDYMAPELAEPQAVGVDYRADIYSLGIIVYQMLAGRLPFEAKTPLGMLRAHVDLAPPPPDSWNSELPASLSEIVMKALAKNPADRYPSAGAFASQLDATIQALLGDRQKDSRLEALYDQATQALGERQWAAALAASGQVMALDANYKNVGELFDMANKGLAEQRAWEAQQEEMAAIYEQAVVHLHNGEWDDAIAAFESLIQGEQVFRDADRKLAETKKSKESEEKRRQERVQELYQQALKAHQEVEKNLGELLKLDPDWQDPEGLFKYSAGNQRESSTFPPDQRQQPSKPPEDTVSSHKSDHEHTSRQTESRDDLLEQIENPEVASVNRVPDRPIEDEKQSSETSSDRFPLEIYITTIIVGVILFAIIFALFGGQ